MKSKILSLLIILLTIMPVYSQTAKSNSEEKRQLISRISELKAKLATLKEGGASKEEIPSAPSEEVKTFSTSGDKKVTCYERTLHTELPAMSDKQFKEFCTTELSKIKELSTNVDDHIITMCRQEGNIVSAGFCVFSNPNAKPLTAGQLSKERQLIKIQNTKKMYQDLIEALNKELAANTIEIVDNAGNLALKHIDLKELEALRPVIQNHKDQAIEKLKEKHGLEEWTPTENVTAEVVDNGIDLAENVASIVPEGKKITCHYLWRIFKSLPEVGKMLGNGGANINIMFQRDEYMKKYQELEQQEQELKAKEVGPTEAASIISISQKTSPISGR